MTEWTDPDRFEAVLEATETLETGRYAESFSPGDLIEHEPGLRLSRWGNEAWMSQTLNHDPAYWRSDVADDRGYAEPPIHPDYLLAATLGMTVEDLSEKGGYFLGRTNVRFHRDVYPGIELVVESEVLSVEESRSRPAYAIITWRTRGRDAATGDVLCSYERTNMIPRRNPLSEPSETDTVGDSSDSGDDDDSAESDDDGDSAASSSEPANGPHHEPGDRYVTPDGSYFEDFRAALETAAEREAVVAYQHERGRTIDDVTVAQLPLATLNTARQHHNADAMADSPSGDVVAYGDVTRSIALGHARSDEATYRELGFDEERFHTFVTPGDTVYGFTRVLETGPGSTDRGVAGSNDGPDGRAPPTQRRSIPSSDAGIVRFQHIAFNQDAVPVYSGIRTAAIRKRDTRSNA